MKLHKSDGSELKYMTNDLYSFPPSLKPWEHVDTVDTQYLNQSYAPLINPVKKTLHIELYLRK